MWMSLLVTLIGLSVAVSLLTESVEWVRGDRPRRAGCVIVRD